MSGGFRHFLKETEIPSILKIGTQYINSDIHTKHWDTHTEIHKLQIYHINMDFATILEMVLFFSEFSAVFFPSNSNPCWLPQIGDLHTLLATQQVTPTRRITLIWWLECPILKDLDVTVSLFSEKLVHLDHLIFQDIMIYLEILLSSCSTKTTWRNCWALRLKLIQQLCSELRFGCIWLLNLTKRSVYIGFFLARMDYWRYQWG